MELNLPASIIFSILALTAGLFQLFSRIYARKYLKLTAQKEGRIKSGRVNGSGASMGYLSYNFPIYLGRERIFESDPELENLRLKSNKLSFYFLIFFGLSIIVPFLIVRFSD